MPVIFYLLSGIGFFSALIAGTTLQFTLASTIVVSAVFCLGFGYMIALLENIQRNTSPRLAGQLERKAELPEGYEDFYHGYPFRRLQRGQIEVLTGNGTRVFKNWQDFHTAVAP